MFSYLRNKMGITISWTDGDIKFHCVANLKIVFASIWFSRIFIIFHDEVAILNKIPDLRYFLLLKIYTPDYWFRNTARLVWKMVEDGCRLHQSSGVYIINTGLSHPTDRIPS